MKKKKKEKQRHKQKTRKIVLGVGIGGGDKIGDIISRRISRGKEDRRSSLLGGCGDYTRLGNFGHFVCAYYNWFVPEEEHSQANLS